MSLLYYQASSVFVYYVYIDDHFSYSFMCLPTMCGGSSVECVITRWGNILQIVSQTQAIQSSWISQGISSPNTILLDAVHFRYWPAAS